ncbi:hypothetical protein DMENIID0001_118460 [Sergentomyia squamirostris]
MAPLSIIHAICLLVCFATLTSAQFQILTDPTRNAFSVTAPGLQQTFTRYFGGGGPQGQAAYTVDPQGAASGQQQQVYVPFSNQQQPYPFVSQYQRGYANGGVPSGAAVQDSVPQYTQQRYQFIEPPHPTTFDSSNTIEAQRIPLRFSPSNEVSSVNFSAGDFNYSF